MFDFSSEVIQAINSKFAAACQWDIPLAQFTTAKVGGPAKLMITVRSKEELADAAELCWQYQLPLFVLGTGANILVSSKGFNGVVIHNQANKIQMEPDQTPPQIYAESGANLGLAARKAALAGISGLEWAAIVPGTVGGAVHGNAGAYGSNVQANLTVVEILQPNSDPVFWNVEQMQYSYRSSTLKNSRIPAIILSAIFHGIKEDPSLIKAKMQTNSIHRKKTQPPGASMGSMFKNPPGDFAGRLIEAAGLKGTSVGGVTVSPIHANFFVNNEQATAEDYWQLIQKVKKDVYDKFQVKLELEIEPIGFPYPTARPTTQIDGEQDD
ncbi:MAG: UDP-N-acetylenolpyruvoylglucosamine reductase [Chloroflexi bacterium 44-23]|nr:MAG: UDP-N-acetylenolpyruvoylglucosamine reductase [Chloroflexi bacterium 44-23]